MTDSLVEVQDLQVQVQSKGRFLHLLNGVELVLREQEILGLVGETGAGKSLTVWSILGLLAPELIVKNGRILFHGQDIFRMSEHELANIRGSKISIIVQNPRTSLDPLTPIGKQLIQMHKRHSDCTTRDARQRAMEVLRQVDMPDAEQRLSSYPHELSGGMAQRVMIGMALINSPEVILADEPTTGLDLTVQAQILDLIRNQLIYLGASAIIVTHDLGIIAQYCDRVAVMFAGRVVELGTVRGVLKTPMHPYTHELVRSASTGTISNQATMSFATRSDLDLAALPIGCHYISRCPYSKPACASQLENLMIDGERTILCKYPGIASE